MKIWLMPMDKEVPESGEKKKLCNLGLKQNIYKII